MFPFFSYLKDVGIMASFKKLSDNISCTYILYQYNVLDTDIWRFN